MSNTKLTISVNSRELNVHSCNVQIKGSCLTFIFFSSSLSVLAGIHFNLVDNNNNNNNNRFLSRALNYTFQTTNNGQEIAITIPATSSERASDLMNINWKCTPLFDWDRAIWQLQSIQSWDFEDSYQLCYLMLSNLCLVSFRPAQANEFTSIRIFINLIFVLFFSHRKFTGAFIAICSFFVDIY
jgi:hypothetical protein